MFPTSLGAALGDLPDDERVAQTLGDVDDADCNPTLAGSPHRNDVTRLLKRRTDTRWPGVSVSVRGAPAEAGALSTRLPRRAHAKPPTGSRMMTRPSAGSMRERPRSSAAPGPMSTRRVEQAIGCGLCRRRPSSPISCTVQRSGALVATHTPV